MHATEHRFLPNHEKILSIYLPQTYEIASPLPALRFLISAHYHLAGGIVAILVALILVLVIIAVVLIVLKRRREQEKQQPVDGFEVSHRTVYQLHCDILCYC